MERLSEKMPKYQEIAFITHLRDAVTVFMVVSMMLVAFVVVGAVDYFGIVDIPDLFYYMLGGIILISYTGSSVYGFMVGYQYWGVSRGSAMLLIGGISGSMFSVLSAIVLFYKNVLLSLVGKDYWVFLLVQLLMVNISFTIMFASLLWLREYGVKTVYVIMVLSVVPGINMIVLPLIGYIIIDRALTELFEKIAEEEMKEGEESGSENKV